MENIKEGGDIKLGGDNQAGWRISSWVENIKVRGNIKVGGEQNAGWRISSWLEHINLDDDYQQ